MKNILKKVFATASAVCMMALPAVSVHAASSSALPDFSGLGAIGSYSEAETQHIAEQIYTGLLNHEDAITLDVQWSTMLEWDDLAYIYRAVLSGWDAGIMTSRAYGNWGVAKKGRYYYVQIVPTYLVEDAEYDARYAELMQKIDEIFSGMDDSWSDAEKALYLHEYLAVYCNYDYDRLNEEISHMPYEMLSSGLGVCEAYARLYNILMHRAGIECAMVESESMAHAWNLVRLDGYWYHVDITWDDSYQKHAGLVKHVNFLKTSDEMLETGHSYDSVNEWVLSSGQIVNQLPTSDFYSDAFWNDCNSMIQPYEGEWFAIHCDPKASNPTAWFDVCDYDASSGTAEITHLNSLDAKWAKWYAFGESGYYLGTYITPAIAGDTIYYTTPSAVFALKDQQIVWLFNLDEEQQTIGYIYGMNKEGNALHYYVSPTPNGEPQEYIYELFEEPEETTATTTTTTPETTTTTTTTTTPETTTTTTTTTTPETTTTTTTTTTTETTTTTTTTTTTETTTTTTSETTTASETEIVTEEPSESEIVPVYGDMNGDDELTVDDVIMLQKYLLNQETLSETQFFLADITNDGDVNIYDFIALKQTIFNQA